MDKMIEHLTENHDEIKIEEYVESSTLVVEMWCICNKIFYSEEDLEKHKELEI